MGSGIPTHGHRLSPVDVFRILFFAVGSGLSVSSCGIVHPCCCVEIAKISRSPQPYKPALPVAGNFPYVLSLQLVVRVPLGLSGTIPVGVDPIPTTVRSEPL